MFFKNITNTQWKNVHGKTTKLKGFEGAGGKKKKWKKKRRQKEKKKIDTTFPCGLNTLLISEEKKKRHKTPYHSQWCQLLTTRTERYCIWENLWETDKNWTY